MFWRLNLQTLKKIGFYKVLHTISKICLRTVVGIVPNQVVSFERYGYLTPNEQAHALVKDGYRTKYGYQWEKPAP